MSTAQKKSMKKIGSREGTPGRTSTRFPTASSVRKVTRETKPKTAYDLLARVAKHILEEPKRYYQNAWVIRNKGRIKRKVGAVPPCGTMACRAGWIVALNDGIDSQPMHQRENTWPSPIAARSDAILGLNGFVTDELYGPEGWCDNDGASVAPGTLAYAREGARGIRDFMKKHAAHLKARKLSDVPKLGRG